MKAHGLADIFPKLEGDDLQALVADIQTNGLHHPIVRFDSQVLDAPHARSPGVERRFEISGRPRGDQGVTTGLSAPALSTHRRRCRANTWLTPSWCSSTT